MALPFVKITNGRVVNDPEQRVTPQGKAVCNFRVATNSRIKNQQTQEWEDGPATFLSVTVWESLAENVMNTFSKGQPISLEGVLSQREYEKDGQKRTVYDVRADEVSVPVPRFRVGENGAQAASPRSNNGQWNNQQGNQQQQQSNDPWGSQPATPGGFNGNADNPPF